MARRGPTKERREDAPSARVRGQGKVNRKLKTLADAFLKNHEGMDVRFVYHPQHKPDLSNVISRQADGYRLVKMEELGEDIVAVLPGVTGEDLVRVGDVVMMAIDADVRAAIQADNDRRAADELSRVEQEFHHNISEIPVAQQEHQMRPRGRSLIEEVEREVDVDPKHKE